MKMEILNPSKKKYGSSATLESIVMKSEARKLFSMNKELFSKVKPATATDRKSGTKNTIRKARLFIKAWLLNKWQEAAAGGKLNFYILFPTLIFASGLVNAQSLNISKLKSETQHRIDTYLDKNHTLGDYYSITDEGFEVFSSPEKKLKKEHEYILYWSDLEQFKLFLLLKSDSPAQELLSREKTHLEKKPLVGYNLTDDRSLHETKNQPLKGIRIALDPGHTAGSIEPGKTEQKYVQIPKDSLHGIAQDVELVEGHLTLTTAMLLKKKLEKAGAEVILTHNNPDETAFGITFPEWKKKHFHHTLDSLVTCKSITPARKTFFLTKATDKQIFMDVFRDLELQKRADLINTFHPDITVIIHYNVDEKNTDWKKFSDKNFVMTFIGGSMTPGELNKPEKRFEFLRMAVTDNLEKSEKLSSCVVQQFSKILQVPIAGKNDATYLRDNCLSTSSEGVYCRNLILTRIIHGTLVYGETLYQDNKEESLNLMQETQDDMGIKTSSRVKQVADSYYQGILDYFRGN